MKDLKDREQKMIETLREGNQALREENKTLRKRIAELEARLDIDYPPYTVDPRVSELQARVDELEGTLARLTPEPGTVFVLMPDPWGEDDEVYDHL